MTEAPSGFFEQQRGFTTTARGPKLVVKKGKHRFSMRSRPRSCSSRPTTRMSQFLRFWCAWRHP